MHENVQFSFFLPTRVLFGSGQVKKLHEQELPGQKALIAISNGESTRKYGYLDTVQDELTKAGVSFIVFDKIQANPTRDNVMNGAVCAQENKCDFVIGLGGGSCLDAAKAIAAMATNDGDLWDYVHGGSGKGQPLQKRPLPIVAITTTAGTGSEADATAVITNEKSKEKIGLRNQAFFPVLSIVDPEMMLSVPPVFTAYQGFDALFHCAEGFLSKAGNLFTDMCALAAIENLSKYLPLAVLNGKDLEARTKVAFANTLGGFIMTLGGVSSQHALEHALSAAYPGLPHGAGLIMISREYFTFHARSGDSDERMIAMSRAMGKDDAGNPMDFVDALVELQRVCGVDTLKMSDYGIRKENLAQYAKDARYTMSRLFGVDPTPITHEDALSILTKAYS
jgi:alcohol dehydrogenase